MLGTVRARNPLTDSLLSFKQHFEVLAEGFRRKIPGISMQLQDPSIYVKQNNIFKSLHFRCLDLDFTVALLLSIFGLSIFTRGAACRVSRLWGIVADRRARLLRHSTSKELESQIVEHCIRKLPSDT